jgi:hypothetical protein
MSRAALVLAVLLAVLPLAASYCNLKTYKVGRTPARWRRAVPAAACLRRDSGRVASAARPRVRWPGGCPGARCPACPSGISRALLLGALVRSPGPLGLAGGGPGAAKWGGGSVRMPGIGALQLNNCNNCNSLAAAGVFMSTPFTKIDGRVKRHQVSAAMWQPTSQPLETCNNCVK